VSSDLARLCALALEIVRRAPGTMRHRISPDEEQHYLDIGLAAAGPGDSEERTRLLTVSSFRHASESEDDLQLAINTGEEAAAMAQRLGRFDLESAALDGITSAHHSTGRYGAMEEPIRRRLELASKLSDPYEVGDIYAMAAWWALNTGRYRESLDLADRGLAHAMPSSPVYALYCLDFRAGAHFRLGDWDGVLADVVVADEILGDRRDSPPGVAPMHLAMAAFIHDARGDGQTAGRYLDLVRWLEQAEDTIDPVLIHWQARLLSRQGRFDDARALLERPDVTEDRRGRDEVLEAWCEVISEQGSWDEAGEVADRAGRHAGWAGLPPLGLYATRLEGRRAAADDDMRRAADLLTTAMNGFEELEAAWEAAVTGLDLAEALIAIGERDRGHSLAKGSASVFERVGSVRELGRAEGVLSR
jgi:tetratricopeptide (TPR) repeat protein